MNVKDAINLYKSRDVSEKVFRADKSYLGNHCLRVASEEAASNKIFIGFLALIIRCRIYAALKEKAKELEKKPNYLTVLAAIRELEKIEVTRQLDKVYRLDHAVTKTQKVILSAFGFSCKISGSSHYMESVWNYLDNMLNTTYYNYKEEGAY